MIDVYYSPIDGGWMADYSENYHLVADTGPHASEGDAMESIKNKKLAIQKIGMDNDPRQKDAE